MAKNLSITSANSFVKYSAIEILITVPSDFSYSSKVYEYPAPTLTLTMILL
jgi:hypothetical protein